MAQGTLLACPSVKWRVHPSTCGAALVQPHSPPLAQRVAREPSSQLPHQEEHFLPQESAQPPGAWGCG